MQKYSNFVFVFLVASFVSILLMPGCSNKSNSDKEQSLRIGIASGYAPFISLDEQGGYEGFDIDVINAIGEKTNRPIKLVDLGSMASLFMALDQGSVDVLIWGLSITKDRLEKVAMINYSGQPVTSYPLLFWQSIPTCIRSIDNIPGMTICVEAGSSQEQALQAYPDIRILYTEKVDDALLNIQYNKTDAALVEPAIARKFRARFPEIQTIDIQLPVEKQVQGIGIALKKENIILIDEITQAVQALKDAGIIATLEQKWGLQ